MQRISEMRVTEIDELALLGLNIADRQRIREVGWRIWLDEVCEAQIKRLAKKSRPETVQTTKRPNRKTGKR